MLEYGMISKGMTNMNFLLKNIVAGIWALILGEVLAYITSQLESMTPDYTLVGWCSVIMGLVVINCVDKITANANPSKNED
ncbi:YjzD family protein [Limosilactobacillus reuteri]|uniref:YjzD family protein n=1 Tax=Limosilactobacillus reuteri TaxID=1598 RepID=UPI003F9BA676